MTHAVDTDSAKDQESVYHLVCHDCPTETVATGEREVQEELEAHRTETGHNVEVAPVTSQTIE